MPTSLQRRASLHYQVEAADLHAHLFRVTLTIDQPEVQQQVSLPAWIPGSYLVREFSKHLQRLSARQQGRPVPVQQLDKSHWQVDGVPSSPLVLSYEVYAYDNSGKPRWYVMPGGSWDATFTKFTGTLYQPQSSYFQSYDARQFRVNAAVGVATIEFVDSKTAEFSYSINGVSGRKSIVRQPFATPTVNPNLAVNDLWWGAASDSGENGWGLTIAQQGEKLFAVWFTYGSDGRTIWYVLPDGAWKNFIFEGDLYATTASGWLGVPFDTSSVKVRRVGTMRLSFTDADNGSLSYSVDGIEQTKTITRQSF